jgi:hypothetical protein
MAKNETEILIFGAEEPPVTASKTLGVSRVPVEAIKANLTAVMSEVGEMVLAAQKAVGNIKVSHVDVQLAIAVDGSVGLLGTGVSTKVTGTLTVRLEV